MQQQERRAGTAQCNVENGPTRSDAAVLESGESHRAIHWLPSGVQGRGSGRLTEAEARGRNASERVRLVVDAGTPLRVGRTRGHHQRQQVVRAGV